MKFYEQNSIRRCGGGAAVSLLATATCAAGPRPMPGALSALAGVLTLIFAVSFTLCCPVCLERTYLQAAGIPSSMYFQRIYGGVPGGDT